MDNFRARRSNEVRSPDRARVFMQMQPRVKPLRKVQVVYYLSRNGQLEHPYYMEILLSPLNPQLRLKDVLNRLTALRGKAMPSHYSWSSKRIYKTGYVWNDLAEEDVIYPTEGAEYVLKGSELIEQNCTAGKLQQLHFRNDQKFHQKRQLPCPNIGNIEQEDDEEEIIHEVEEDNNNGVADITSDTSSSAPPSRCSKGASCTKGSHEVIQKSPNSLTTLNDSPSSTTSSSNVSEKAIQGSKTFEGNQPVEMNKTKSSPSRTSLLFQLIACGTGSSAGLKSKYLHGLVQDKPSGSLKDSSCSCGSSFRGGVSKNEIKVVEDEIMINCMSENPRFANLQSQEKEYFSGSIVMSMATEDRVADESVLKRSNSYNEERSKRVEMPEAAAEKMVEEELEEKQKSAKGKCIPRKKYSSAAAKTTKKVTT